MILELLDLVFGGLLAASSHSQQREVQPLLERVARALDGPLRRGWLRADRIDGHFDGREIELRWLGHGVAEVRCRVQSSVELSLRRAGFLRRLFGRHEPSVHGDDRLAEPARALFRRYDGRFLRVENGRLVFRAAPGMDAGRLIGFARDVVDLVWREARPTVTVRGRPASSEGGENRCPFCHDDLAEDAPVVFCDACEAPHHPSCFEEGGGCSIAGCREQRARGRRQKS